MHLLFRLGKQDRESRARTGVLNLAHGSVQTPCFMPVGTNASVKASPVESLEMLGIRLILSNAYHLYLRPGIEVIEKAGGLHKFMAWKHNILTDSGGFQIFSLTTFREIEDEGVCFRSHIDGSLHRLTPEDVVNIQDALGSDILMPLDVCTPFGAPYREALEAVERTSDWARRSCATWMELTADNRGCLFGIVQGNFFKDLRARSIDQLCALDLPGYALGGLSVGEPFPEFQEALASTAVLLPESKPRYLMGIGTPDYILEAVENGIDLFDCVYPTRTARNALAFSRSGPVNLRLEANKMDNRPIDPECRCSTCERFSRSYLRHLFKAKEIMAAVLTTHHNLFFIQDLMDSIRTAVHASSFLSFKKEFLRSYKGGESS